MRYYENVMFPPESKAVLDVTKAPYFLDPTGKEDCTQKLKTILDDLLQGMIAEMQKVYETLQESPNGTYISRENRKLNDRIYAVFPCEICQVPMIYFPNGTYLVSDTISYTLKELHNMMYVYESGGFELNRCIRMIGQSKEKTIIKLKDYCKGFEYGQQRPVINFMLGGRSNVAMSNYFENITIDIGKGNPGAVGLVFFANNSGAVRNVTIKSSDENRDGAIGLWMKHEIASACNVYSVTIEGFDYGILVSTYRTCAHFEDITLLYPKKYGIKIDNNAVQVIGLSAKSNVPVLFTAGPMAHVILVNAKLESEGTNYAALKYGQGCLYLRNIHTSGFDVAFEKNWYEESIPDGYIKEYCNRKMYTLFDEKAGSLGLEIAPLPDVQLEHDLDKWCCVNDYGAVGDGIHDDTEAIAAALASGKPVVWFQPGHYLITKPIDIPETVRHVHYMYCDIYTGEELQETGDAIFCIKGESKEVLLLEKLFSWNDCAGNLRMYRHDSKRTVYMRDMHTQACAFYFNTVPGAEVFFENCACTIGDKKVYGHMTGFEFNGQTAWCHAINPERSAIETINRGGQMWWSGFKTEQEGSINVTTDGGTTEILGGNAAVGHAAEDVPLIDNDNSDVAAIFSNTGYHDYSTFPIAVREKREEEIKVIRDEECPQRCWPWYLMPLYSGRGKK